jgi:hypothetical protein
MKTTGFTETQKQSLLDLLIIGMYADHNLTSAENACVVRLLDTFQFSSDYERKQFCDAAFTRASRHTGSPEAIRAYVTQVAGNFPTRDLRRGVYDTLSILLTNDGRITTEESQLLGTVREIFQS